MDGQIDGQIDGRIDGQMDGQTPCQELLHHSTLGLRVIEKKKKRARGYDTTGGGWPQGCQTGQIDGQTEEQTAG